MTMTRIACLAAAALLGATMTACQAEDAPAGTAPPVESTIAADEQGGGTAPAAGAVRIVEPADGATIPAGPAIVRVEVEGVPEAGAHWHFWVDGEQAGMVTGVETEIDLAPGEHVLEAALSSADSHEEDPNAVRSTVNVTVTP